MFPFTRQRTGAPKTPRQHGATAVIAVLMLCAAAMVAMIAMIVSVAGGRSDAPAASGTLIVGDLLDMVSFDSPVGSDRPIFKHSVVAGGVYTPDELRNVLVQDAIVATHYQKFNPNAARAETVKQDRFAYVSYRKDNQIYWTRNKVKLSEGETILTDGTNEIRARCGNCISDTPQFPVAEVEPASAEFDQFVDSGSRSLSAAVRAALESPWFGAGQGSGGPGAAGGGPARGASPSGSDPAGPMASASPGGAGGSARPASLASRGLSPDGPAGLAGGGAGNPADTSSSPGSSSNGSGSPAANPSALGGSSGAAPGRSISDAPGTPLSASSPGPAPTGAPIGRGAPGAPGNPSAFGPAGSPLASGAPGNPLSSGSPGSPLTSGSPGLAGPTSGVPSLETPSLSPAAAASVPPGIDPPPGFDPAAGVEPSASTLAASAVDSGEKPVVASIPEPGMLLLLGTGAAVAVLRRLRIRQ